MVILLLFTKVMNALVSSNTNLGKKLPKNDATITWKNDDATVNFLEILFNRDYLQTRYPQTPLGRPDFLGRSVESWEVSDQGSLQVNALLKNNWSLTGLGRKTSPEIGRNFFILDFLGLFWFWSSWMQQILTVQPMWQSQQQLGLQCFELGCRHPKNNN